MTCALKGFSKMKCGKSKKLKSQYEEMSKFYHGDEPNRPSQIKLLANAHINYRDLYDEVIVKCKNKQDTMADIITYRLKKVITQDLSRDYYSNRDIRVEDLEKKNRTGSQLITGRNLVSLAVKGVKTYKKALSLCAHKWDLDTNEPLESGDKIEDCVEYVRVKMYHLLVKRRGNTNDCDSVSETDEVPDSENIDTENGSTTDGATLNKDKEGATLNKDKDASMDAEDSSYQNIDDKSSEKEDVEVPADYIFPSFFVFILHGPFVPKDDRLSLFLIDDKSNKKGDGSRSTARNEDKKRKASESHHDSTAIRGFTTEQRIDIENLNVQRQIMKDRQIESKIVGLSIESGAIEKQIAHAERRAEIRCAEYDPSNLHWKRVDDLLKQQDDVVKRLHDMNKSTSQTVNKVSEFLNQSSPKKAKLSSKKSSIPQEVIVDSDVNMNESDTEEDCDDNKGESEENFDNETNVSKRN